MARRVGKYEIGKTLGEGAFGKVKLAVNTETGEKVAIKVLDKDKIQKQNMGGQIPKEVNIMKKATHKHVVGLREVLASRSKIFIVLDLVTGGELFDKIVEKSRFEEPMACKYFWQTLEGVGYCHDQGVCHRDLKPENLLLDEKGDLKISDFGLSTMFGAQCSLHTICGTPNYVAPEVLQMEYGYDGRTADVWSIGVILYVLLAGFLPFNEPTMPQLFEKIQRAEFADFPEWFSPQVRDLLSSILVADPNKRATIAQLKTHTWVQENMRVLANTKNLPEPQTSEIQEKYPPGHIAEMHSRTAQLAEEERRKYSSRVNSGEITHRRNPEREAYQSRVNEHSQARMTSSGGAAIPKRQPPPSRPVRTMGQDSTSVQMPINAGAPPPKPQKYQGARGTPGVIPPKPQPKSQYGAPRPLHPKPNVAGTTGRYTPHQSSPPPKPPYGKPVGVPIVEKSSPKPQYGMPSQPKPANAKPIGGGSGGYTPAYGAPHHYLPPKTSVGSAPPPPPKPKMKPMNQIQHNLW